MALIYFLTTDPALARKEAEEAGWYQIAINRWATPDRNDVRIITSRRDFQFIPGGTLILPARDLKDVRATAIRARKEADEVVRSSKDDRGEVAAALRARHVAYAQRAEAMLEEAVAFKQMVDDGAAQWVGNLLLGDDKTHELIAGIEPVEVRRKADDGHS